MGRRSKARECAFQILYQWDITKEPIDAVIDAFWRVRSGTPQARAMAERLARGAERDAKALDAAIDELTVIAGQRAQVRRATKSIASFKLREGMPVGARVTLRGARMYEFLDRLASIALPRIRDFRGLDPGSFDGRGNYSIGVREQLIFPEIDYDKVPAVRGLDIAITTSATSDEHGRALLGALGMPFAAGRREQ